MKEKNMNLHSEEEKGENTKFEYNNKNLNKSFTKE